MHQALTLSPATWLNSPGPQEDATLAHLLLLLWGLFLASLHRSLRKASCQAMQVFMGLTVLVRDRVSTPPKCLCDCGVPA